MNVRNPNIEVLDCMKFSSSKNWILYIHGAEYCYIVKSWQKLCQVESGCLTSIFKLTNFLVFPTNLDVEPLNLIFSPLK